MLLRDDFALKLLSSGMIKFGQFRLKLHDRNPDAPLSPIYVDLRLLRSYPNIMDYAISVYEIMMKCRTFDVIADIPTAATPIVSIISYKLGIPMITPRTDHKTHGSGNKIDGVFNKGVVALVIDDLITRADSKLEAISILEDNGIKVHDVLVLLDREQGGVEELRSRGYNCLAYFKLRELLEIYLRLNRIDTLEYDRVLAYLGRVP